MYALTDTDELMGVRCEQGILVAVWADDLGLCPYCTPGKNSQYLGKVVNHGTESCDNSNV